MKKTLLIIGVVAALALPSPRLAATTFTTDTLISPNDTTYDGQELIVSTCTLTVNGPHAFNSLLLTNGAVLTHSPAPNGEAANLLNLSIAQDLVIDGSSRLDVSALGYAAANGPGAGGSSTTKAGSGGGHGGLGGTGSAGAVTGWTYDAILAPTQPGSGGGNGYFSTGGNGGGVVRLTINGVLQINGGQLRAEGGRGSGNTLGGGGSGGSIAVTAGQLRGFGIISANGGSASSGGGGAGGRIAINCTNNTFTGSMTAYGGPGFEFGGAGTVLLRTTGQPVGEVRVDNGGNAGQLTPLSSPAPYNLILANQAVAYALAPLTNGNLTIKSNGLLTHLRGDPGLTVKVLSNLVVEAGGRLDVSGKGWGAGQGPGSGASATLGGGGGASHGGNGGAAEAAAGVAYDSLVAPAQLGSGGGNGYNSSGGSGGGALFLTVVGTLRVDGTLSADGANGAGYIYGGGGAGGSLALNVGTLAGGGAISANGGGTVAGGGGGGGRIAVFYATNSFLGVLSAYGGTGAKRGGAGTIFTQAATAMRGQVSINNGGTPGGLTRLNPAFWEGANYFDLVVGGAARLVPDTPLTFGNFTVGSGATVSQDPAQPGLQIVALNDLTVETGAAINVDGLGQGAGLGAGAGGNSAAGGGGGGGYGGAGGAGQNTGGQPNGGVGGAPYGSAVQPLDLGSGGGAGFASSGGAGGGSVRLSAGRILLVNGTISANGAPNADYLYGGGGSGGSIFLTAGVLSGSGLISANGGSAVNGGGGGGGRIAMYAGVLVDLPTPPRALGGVSGDGSDTDRNGQDGTLLKSTSLPPFQVASMSPAGFVMHSVSNVDITFNSGVSSNSVSVDSVVLTTPSGPLPSNQLTITPAGGPVFRVSFPAQSAVGQYSVQIGPHIQDLFGREMDQNGNGIPGETPGDLFSGRFTIAPAATLSGTIHLANGNGAGVANVTLQAGTNAPVLTDANGHYTLELPQGWSGNVTPSKVGCTFSPSSRTYANLTGALAGQDYTLTQGFVPTLRGTMQGLSYRVEWLSIVGIRYQIQTSSDLVHWTNAGQPMLGTGDTLFWLFDSTSNPSLFVRVLANN